MLADDSTFKPTPFRKLTPEETAKFGSKQWKSADLGIE